MSRLCATLPVGHGICNEYNLIKPISRLRNPTMDLRKTFIFLAVLVSVLAQDLTSSAAEERCHDEELNYLPDYVNLPRVADPHFHKHVIVHEHYHGNYKDKETSSTYGNPDVSAHLHRPLVNIDLDQRQKAQYITQNQDVHSSDYLKSHISQSQDFYSHGFPREEHINQHQGIDSGWYQKHVSPVNPDFRKEAEVFPKHVHESDQVGSPHMSNKKIGTMIFYPLEEQGYEYPSYYRGYYRAAGLVPESDTNSDPASERAADPHKHAKKYKTKGHSNYNYYSYGSLYRDADGGSDITESVSSPFLFDTPVRSNEEYGRSSNSQSTDDFPVQVVGAPLLIDVPLRAREDTPGIFKRSIQLNRLATDPNVKLDLEKTVENVGTATKNALEDEGTPLFHLKHLLGSSRNALLAGMRMTPQNLIIPSDYEIVKMSDPNSHEIPDEPSVSPFSKTFNRVGKILRDSIKSGQETAGHIGNIAHQARNMIYSSRYATPRLVAPLSQIPVLESTQNPQKTILLAPRLLDISDQAERVSSPQSDLVQLGHIMDATGVSNPEHTTLQKITFESDMPLGKKFEKMYNRFASQEKIGRNLERAKSSVGAKNLQDFVKKMKSQLSDVMEKKKKNVDKHEKNKEIDKFIEKLFDGKREQQAEKKEIVGGALPLAPELLKPFMNRASSTELDEFLKDNGDTGLAVNKEKREFIVDAVNPLQIDSIFNETAPIKNENEEVLQAFLPGGDEFDSAEVRTFMAIDGMVLKPFMGAQNINEDDSSQQSPGRDKIDGFY